MLKILVTGAYGYIGSHVVKTLAEYGYKVFTLDMKSSTNDILKYSSKHISTDLSKYQNVANHYDCVIHLAGLISVQESVEQPWLYTLNNIHGTHNALNNFITPNFIFASTAAAFNPVSPYAQTKLLAESIIRSKGVDHTIFRFFNVAGSNGIFGQIGEATHLIRIAAKVAAGKLDYMNVYGTDWPTRDGTCIRDYIHVSDLVEAIIKAVQAPQNTFFECIGTGQGYTVKEVIDTMNRVTNKNITTVNTDRRAGDNVSTLIPESYDRSKLVIPTRTLEDICESAYKYEIMTAR